MRKETPIRSIAKSVTWRVLATFTTIILVYLFTGKIGLSLAVGVLEVIVKLIIYYFHERAWVKIRWGLKNKNDA